ncbi:MAG: HAD family hydrolase [Verrucomicrobiae bacterium]|nr:HAD family hydrolase [Verrucomicrobiae bacterium]MDW8343120.1 HAD family hydrolase [Verrucomicrobiae bacterium]
MNVRGVIFDMDGTITEPYLDFARIKKEIGVGDVDILDYLQTATGRERDRVLRILERFEDDGAQQARLNRGARTLLRYLKRHGIHTGLLTRNSRRSVDIVCQRLGLRFDLISTREDGPYKPAPEPIWIMGRVWGLRREELLMVGDYKWDVLCARNAGIASAVLVNGSVPEWATLATYRVRRLTELIPILEGQHS